MSQASGFFVVIEGLDGSGKTHLSRALKSILQKTHGKNVELTFEPHDPSTAGLFIRQVLTMRIKNVKARTLALAYALNRADHNDRIIRPYLEADPKRIMICDRYYMSSLVYQSTDGVSMDEIMVLNRDVRKPDLTLFLSVNAETGYERMRKRPASKELFETNLETMRHKYHEAIEFLRARGELIVEIDANGTIEEVLESVLNELAKHSPTPLNIQHPVLETGSEIFAFDEIDEAEAKIQQCVERFGERWSDDKSDLTRLKSEIEAEIDSLSYDDLGLIFLGYLKRWGYVIGERLAWTEMCAYELVYEMPLQLKQQGTALLLTETQRFDQATKKLQLILDQTPDYDDINRLSNFMFVLDGVPSRQIENYYESDAGTGRISPTVRIMHRQDIAGLLSVDILAAFNVNETPHT
jgi:dTMP kinase